MKVKLTIVTVLFILFIGFIIIKFTLLNNQSVFGRLKVISSPSATIFMDNVAINSGRTPYDNDRYKIGEYLFKLIPEGIATDTASWQRKIRINKNAMTYVNVELGSSDISTAAEIFTPEKISKATKNPQQGEIYVETEPSGAIIWLDNDEKGIAPLQLSDIPRGEHEIAVTMPGFFDRRKKINIESGYRVNSFIKLSIDQTKSKAIKTKPINGKDEKNASESAEILTTYVLIKDTPTGWLRVRDDASINASESGKVKPGEKYEILEEKPEWYKIKIADKEGWISSIYSEKKKE